MTKRQPFERDVLQRKRFKDALCTIGDRLRLEISAKAFQLSAQVNFVSYKFSSHYCCGDPCWIRREICRGHDSTFLFQKYMLFRVGLQSSSGFPCYRCVCVWFVIVFLFAGTYSLYSHMSSHLRVMVLIIFHFPNNLLVCLTSLNG